MKKILLALVAVMLSAVPSYAAWSSVVDLTSITTDLTIVGGAVIGLVLLIVGFRYVKGMVKSK